MHLATRNSRRPNDLCISCKAALHSDGDRGTRLAPHSRMAVRGACRRRAWIALAGPLGPRANKRRFDSFLQKLGGPFGVRRAASEEYTFRIVRYQGTRKSVLDKLPVRQ